VIRSAPIDITRCPRCNHRVRSLQIDDTDERVLVSGPMISVAIRIPGLEGYTTTTTNTYRVHGCLSG
jgi:hypothetical protein